jgi:hypothetical protein
MNECSKLQIATCRKLKQHSNFKMQSLAPLNSAANFPLSGTSMQMKRMLSAYLQPLESELSELDDASSSPFNFGLHNLQMASATSPVML